MIDFDFSELDKLAADLGDVGEKAGQHVRRAVEISARNVKEYWAENAKGMDHAPAFPASITYDMGANHSLLRNVFGGGGANSIQADIGPDKDRTQGALGNLIEYGSRNNPPMGLGHGALQRESENFEWQISKAAHESLKELDL